MIGKTNVVDELIGKLRRHPALKGAVPIIDHLEAVLEDLFASPNRRAIEMSDEIRAVIERKHISMDAYGKRCDLALGYIVHPALDKAQDGGDLDDHLCRSLTYQILH